MAAHIHAENMKLYAQDAAETDRPWLRWEFNDGDGSWLPQDCDNPRWFADFQYRRKPRTHTVNGFEVPGPMWEMPNYGTKVFIAYPIDYRFFMAACFYGEEIDRMWLKRGLVHATKEAAIANAKAMLGIQP